MDSRDLPAELEADARDITLDANEALCEQLDADDFDQWEQALQAMPEAPELPPIDCHDPIDPYDFPY